MKKNTVIVHLTGGLGNQLFQYAAALSLNPSKISLESSIGKPRRNQLGDPEIASFELIQSANFVETTNSLNFFASKAAGFILRSGVSPKNWEKNRIIMTVLKIAGELVLSIWSRKHIRIIQGNGVGYSPLDQKNTNQYLIGYFQSHIYSDSVESIVRQIGIKQPGHDLLELIKAAETELPLVVHYRFGDYLQETKFGLPSNLYYQRAIKEIWDTGKCKKIWVFSDEIETAKSQFPTMFLDYVRWIENVDDSSAATLEAMRLGKGYVIANSTFSWWGAYLCKNPEVPVTVPSPWFHGMPSPSNMIPPSWKTLDAKV